MRQEADNLPALSLTNKRIIAVTLKSLSTAGSGGQLHTHKHDKVNPYTNESARYANTLYRAVLFPSYKCPPHT